VAEKRRGVEGERDLEGNDKYNGCFEENVVANGY